LRLLLWVGWSRLWGWSLLGLVCFFFVAVLLLFVPLWFGHCLLGFVVVGGLVGLLFRGGWGALGWVWLCVRFVAFLMLGFCSMVLAVWTDGRAGVLWCNVYFGPAPTQGRDTRGRPPAHAPGRGEGTLGGETQATDTTHNSKANRNANHKPGPPKTAAVRARGNYPPGRAFHLPAGRPSPALRLGCRSRFCSPFFFSRTQATCVLVGRFRSVFGRGVFRHRAGVRGVPHPCVSGGWHGQPHFGRRECRMTLHRLRAAGPIPIVRVCGPSRACPLAARRPEVIGRRRRSSWCWPFFEN